MDHAKAVAIATEACRLAELVHAGECPMCGNKLDAKGHCPDGDGDVAEGLPELAVRMVEGRT